MMGPVLVGVDFGGTSVKVGICSRDGNLLYSFEGATGTGEPEEVVRRIADYVRQAVEESPYDWDQVAGIGAGVAGFLNREEGTIALSPNLEWRNIPIKRWLQSLLQKRVEIDNDANAAALGEAWCGAAKGLKNVVCYVLGTGVGGAVIVDGIVVHGSSGMAGEIGHIPIVPDLEAVVCGCGQRGCLETVSSARGIVRMANDAKMRGDKTVLAEVEQITAKDVFDAAGNGDEVAKRIVERSAFYLGKSMALLSVILNPERFVVAGGVSLAGAILFDKVRETFQKCAPEAFQKGVDIVPARLGHYAGVIGAARLVL